ncbi:MAG: hypothetical protein ACQUHE_10745, partial [Bacteroidia bacterium]
AFLVSSCSVQQFAVNTDVKPFQNGGRVWGERVKKGGETPWKLTYKKDSDFHIVGINLKQADAKKMADEMNAVSYTIETKSNIVVEILTFGLADYKIVKVIKRDR